MRVRLFVEVEFSDEGLLQQFGENLPNVTQEIPAGLARAVEGLIRQVPHVNAVGSCIIPTELMTGASEQWPKIIT
jgi:hypothetical protein